MLGIIKALAMKFVAGFISKATSFKASSTDENKSTESALESDMYKVLAGFVLGVVLATGIHLWSVSDLLEERQAAADIKSEQLTENANAKAVQLQEDLDSARANYELANAELVRLRLENAVLRGSQSSGAAAECNQELAKREDLLLRMASLGLRTSEAVAEKQAALKNCVGNYAGIKAQ